ncbi:poly [ADP-ribose] polymerase 2-like [Styela clava]
MPPRKRQAKQAVASSRPKRGKNDDNSKKDDPNDDAKQSAGKGKKTKNTATVKPDVKVKKENTKVKQEPDSKASSSEEKADIKKLTFSGSVPVDEHCAECSSGYHVYIDQTQNSIYNAMLNQTNIGFNNNKYYILQILKQDTQPQYVTWFRWGRVGKIAGTAIKRHGGNLDAAKTTFEKKFRDKTGNIWNTPSFIKIPGKYDLLEMDYGEDTKDDKKKVDDEKKKKREEVESKLDKRLQEVIDLIFDVKEFEACVKELEFDVKKAPLGKLTSKQIKAGYETLKKIEKCHQENKYGRELADACSEFYTRIPHDFGMKVPPLIRTPAQLKLKIQLLEALSDIQIAIQMMDEDDDKTDDVNIKDLHYQSLDCKLEPLDKTHDEYKMVKTYVSNSHGSTHNQYALDLENVYKVEREGEEQRFKKDIGNRMLLWHGSRLTNWCGILKQGLRIAPPEAPSTGYMFGKGVYFADMISKSANYCHANHRQPSGFLLLCEVALGNTNDKTHADYDANKLPKGKHSTKGLGREEPDPQGYHTMDCGTLAPLGKPKAVSDNTNRYLMYNEYIVYDVAQIRARYLVKAKFNYKSHW